MMKLVLILLVLISFTEYSIGVPVSDIKNKVPNSAEEICPIKVGEQIPSVGLSKLDGNEVNLKDLVKGKRTILIFYRGGWCPFCNLQLASLNLIEKDLVNLQYQLIAVSIDKPGKLKESIGKHQINYTLLSDSKANASTAFGLAFKVEDAYNNMLLDHNMNIEEASDEKHHILPVPAVFIVDKNGVVQFEYVNPNYKIRLNEQILLKAAEQYSLD